MTVAFTLPSAQVHRVGEVLRLLHELGAQEMDASVQAQLRRAPDGWRVSFDGRGGVVMEPNSKRWRWWP